MNNKRLVITSIISIFLVSLLLIYSTYAIFTSTEIDAKENVYTTGNLDITYTVSDDNEIMTDTTPTSIDDSIIKKPYRIKVSNNGNVAYKFNIILTDTTASNKLNYHYIMTQVGKLNPILLSDCENNIIKKDVIVLPNNSVDIDVRVWVTDTILNTEIGKSFYAKLSIDGLAVNTDEIEIDNSNLIANMAPKVIEIMEKNAISDANIDFSKPSSDTNGKGIYVKSNLENTIKSKIKTNTTESSFETNNPIYYYRGDVKDNNVIFANMCFKIVRTTNSGGIKLIYNGLPNDNNTCNKIGEDTVISEGFINSANFLM